MNIAVIAISIKFLSFYITDFSILIVIEIIYVPGVESYVACYLCNKKLSGNKLKRNINSCIKG